jgi:hypothetical protein
MTLDAAIERPSLRGEAARRIRAAIVAGDPDAATRAAGEHIALTRAAWS